MQTQTIYYYFLRIILLLTITCTFRIVHGQQINFLCDNITVKDGLAHNNVYSIFQDNSGYMWFGTQNGLSRYDGYKFTTFRNEPGNINSLSTSNFGKISQDSSGLLWFGTYGEGVDLYDPKTHTFTNLSNIAGDSTSLSNNLITFIFHDSHGETWIGTANGGLNKYNRTRGNFTRFQFSSLTNNCLSDDRTTGMCESSDGSLWIATQNGLNKFDKQSQNFTHYFNIPGNQNSISGNVIQHVIADEFDAIWLAVFNGGINKLDPTTGTIIRFKNDVNDKTSLSDNKVDYLFIDSYKQFWVGTFEEGISLFDRSTGTFFNFNQESQSDLCVNGNRIEYIFEDNSKVLWVATRGSGVFKMDLKPKKFNNLIYKKNHPTSLSDPNVTSIDSDTLGNLWIGTDGGGLSKFNTKNETFQHFRFNANEANSLSDDRVWSVLVDCDGVVWAGTFNGGLNRIEYKNNSYHFQHFKHNPDASSGISSNQINIIKQDAHKNIWVGTANGLNKLVLNEFSSDYQIYTYYHNPIDSQKFIDNYVSHFIIDSQNHLWLGSVSEGLFQFLPEKNTFVKYKTVASSTMNNSHFKVIYVYQNHEKNIFIGTESQGIQKFDTITKTFLAHPQNAKLIGNAIMAITEDNLGNLWISSSGGLFKHNQKTDEFNIYGFEDGLVGIGFNRNALHYHKQGNLFFGSNSGLTFFNPAQLTVYSEPPKTVITSFEPLNHPLWNQYLVPFQAFMNMHKTIFLTRKDYFFTIGFSAMDYGNPRGNEFEFKMENFDEDWIYAGENHSATYTNLDPGHYIFKVRGRTSDKIWSKAPAELKITIIPPVWKRTWFYALEVLFMLVLLFVYVRLRMLMLIKDKRILERKISERTKQISQQKEELETQAHFLEIVNKRLENQHDELERLVAERTADLEIAKNRAEESDRLKSAFLANMSHEIRTPMNAIVGFSMLLKDNEMDPLAKEELVDLIVENSDTLLQLINNIIDISKIEAGQLVLFKKPCDIVGFMQNMYEYAKDQNEKLSIDIRLIKDVSGPFFMVNTDEGRLEQVFQNLLSNAIKFTEKGTIELGYYVQKQLSETALVFYVRDTGIGLSEKKLPSIFSRFLKVEENTGKIYRGAGLGLAISKSLVELMDGKIWVESLLGKGSTFYFSLPIEPDTKNAT